PGQESVIVVIEVLVEQRHLPLRWSQSCHHEKPERLPHPITIQAVRADLVQTDDRVVRIHKIESHYPLALCRTSTICCVRVKCETGVFLRPDTNPDRKSTRLNSSH